ncbi:MAG: hypothetical protein J7621_04670 [Niastella sp.]|nr:hypothetical protein [Niastella sp.]
MLFALSLIACKDNIDAKKMDKITRSLNRTNKLIDAHNEEIYSTLERKLRSVRTRAKAEIWNPKALRVKKLSAGLYAYIDSLQKQVSSPDATTKEIRRLLNKESGRLHGDLAAYCEAVSVIDTTEFVDNSRMLEALKRDMVNLRKFIALRLNMGMDSTLILHTDARQLARMYFDNTTPAQASMVLSKFRNDILVIENGLAVYFNMWAVNNYCGYTPGCPVIGMINVTHVKAGHGMEVYAGRGSYSTEADPRITIGDSTMGIGPDGTTTYDFIAKGKPGKYTIPVQIEYYKPDGSKNTFTKKLEYTIAE